jgi:hypothetical protein
MLMSTILRAVTHAVSRGLGHVLRVVADDLDGAR